MAEITESDFDTLALQACEALGYEGGRVAAYDVAGYTRILRREMPPAQIEYRELPAAQERPLPAQARLEDRPYLVRIGGFHRNNLYGPDEVGALFRNLGIAWNDGLGNGIYESLLIDRKYGLAHSLEAPAYDFSLPFFDEDRPAFQEQYSRHLDRLEARLTELEPGYGSRLLQGKDGVCVLHTVQNALTLFVRAYQQHRNRVTDELQRQTGRPVPPIKPATPSDRLALVKFWSLVRARHGRSVVFLADLLKDRFGSKTAIVGNFHDLPIYDFESFGIAFDYPAVAVRPLLLEDDLMLRYYTAYFTRLFSDLNGKPPMVSIRTNLSAAGCRFVPGPNLVRRWTDQALQCGAGGFYLWPRDYPMDQANPYDGPIPGNPEPATRPQERWETCLQIHGELATRQRFLPPLPGVAILVPFHSALLYRQEWRRIYTAFSACSEAVIYSGFIGDWQAAGAGIPDHVRMLIIPVLEFVSPALRAALEGFIRKGGTLLSASGDLYDQDGKPVQPLEGAKSISVDLFEVFPLDSASSESTLQDLAGFLNETVKQNGIQTHSWVFDLTLASLPPASKSDLRASEPQIQFDHWLYEHGSKWIYPYIKR